MSQHKLGAAIGSSQTYIRLLEGGLRTPSVTAFLSIANALGVDSRMFLGDVLRRMEQLEHAPEDSPEH